MIASVPNRCDGDEINFGKSKSNDDAPIFRCTFLPIQAALHFVFCVKLFSEHKAGICITMASDKLLLKLDVSYLCQSTGSRGCASEPDRGSHGHRRLPTLLPHQHLLLGQNQEDLLHATSVFSEAAPRRHGE